MLSGDRDVSTEFVPGSFRAFELVFLQLILLWIIYRENHMTEQVAWDGHPNY